jgi:hypothetical protein
MTSPNSPGRDGHLDGRAAENRLRIWTEYHGPCVVVGVAGEIDIATADRLRLQVIIAVLAAISPSLVIDLGGVAVSGHAPPIRPAEASACPWPRQRREPPAATWPGRNELARIRTKVTAQSGALVGDGGEAQAADVDAVLRGASVDVTVRVRRSATPAVRPNRDRFTRQSPQRPHRPVAQSLAGVLGRR